MKKDDQSPETQQDPTPEAEPVVKSDTRKTAFFITPLGGDTSDVRRATDGLIAAVIRPTLDLHGIDLIPPHEISDPGTITRQIIRQILKANLVIANLTGLNPNVMYELAVRHATRLPTIIIAQDDTKLPFDLAAERTIFYQNDMAGVVQLTKRLNETIPGALADKQPDNPIYNGIESLIISEKAEREHDSVQTYIIDKLERLSDSVSFLRNNPIYQKMPSSSRQSNTLDDFNAIPTSEIVNLKLFKPGEQIGYHGVGLSSEEEIIHRYLGPGRAKGIASARGKVVFLIDFPSFGQLGVDPNDIIRDEM